MVHNIKVSGVIYFRRLTKFAQFDLLTPAIL